MITHFLGKEEVNAFCSDLANRLNKLDSSFPTLWIALGPSGAKLAKSLASCFAMPQAQQINIAVANFNRSTGEVVFDESTPEADLPKEVGTTLVIDSAVHSGRSMLALSDKLSAMGFTEQVSYSLVLKQSSVFVPTFFGLVIDDKDRIYFDLPALPNNRLVEKPPFGLLRKVTEKDVGRTIEDIGAPFDELSVGDLIYEQETRGFQPYVYEIDGKLVAFVSFRKAGAVMFVDGWGTSKLRRGLGIGAALLRWAETWARVSKCEAIELWAYEDAIPVYEHYGYKFKDEKVRDLGEGLKYRIMHREILYNIRISADDLG